MKNLSLLLLALFAAHILRAQNLNLKNLTEFSVETSEIRNVKLGNRKPEQKIEKYIFRFINQGETADGYKLSCKMVHANIRHNDSGVFLFNSDSIRNTITDNSAILEPLVFLENSFTVYVSSDGKTIKAEGIDELMQRAFRKWHIAESTREWFDENTAKKITSTLRKIFIELPGPKIAYQSTWANKATGVNYKVTAIAGSLLTITGIGADTLTAKYTLNDTNGLLEDAQTHWKRLIDSIRWVETIDYTHKLIYDRHIAATVDTAWAGMALTLSWNSLLRPGLSGNVDSAVTFGYFKQYDPIYNDDPFYIKQKVTLVNQMRLKDHDIYKQLVIKTPHKYLTDVELHNKMNYIAGADFEAFYDFVMYRAKSDHLKSWLQDAMITDLIFNSGTEEQQLQNYKRQGFSDQKAREKIMERERTRQNKMMLLERLYNGKDVGLKQQVAPLYYWYIAYQNKDNAAILKKTAAQFKKIKHAELIAGNAGRYGVLLYKLLSNAGLNDEAEDVLDKTIADYEKILVSDTTYNNGTPRAIYYSKALQAILMAGYYVKYKHLAKTDSVKALPYLAKAAQYSPTEAVNYNSPGYADRSMFMVFMQLKDSYRKAYIEKLFDMGDLERGLKLFAMQINANIGSIDELQKMFQKRFPDRNFSDFFVNNVIGGWKDALDWTGKDVDEKEYKLADYKGKWLVIDFWATWCPPCREEMPKVVAYNKELLAGKHSGISLLGVSNGEDAKTVRTYFDKAKLNLPTVLGSGNLYKYGVTAIPTKCFIAPNGKMMLLNHGLNWQKVIAKLNELYPGS